MKHTGISLFVLVSVPQRPHYVYSKMYNAPTHKHLWFQVSQIRASQPV